MAATNTTTNYGLPIFVTTDKFEMSDWNSAMTAIDTQMKAMADAIAAIDLENFIKYDATNGSGLTWAETAKLMKQPAQP
jgi:hypothetical protein